MTFGVQSQYAVLEANALKSMRKANIRTPTIRNPSTNFDVMWNILLRPPKRVDVQNLVKIDWAVTDLRMRKKHVLCGFFINISVYLSVCPFLRRGYRSQFWGDFYA